MATAKMSGLGTSGKGVLERWSCIRTGKETAYCWLNPAQKQTGQKGKKRSARDDKNIYTTLLQRANKLLRRSLFTNKVIYLLQIADFE